MPMTASAMRPGSEAEPRRETPAADTDGATPETVSESRGDGSRPDPILQRRDFLKASRAQSVATPAFVLQGRRRDRAESERDSGAIPAHVSRLGLTASKKVGNAVVRNRCKRRLRALGWAVLPLAGRPGWDYVLVARAGETVSRTFALMETELREALVRVHEGRGSRRPPKSRGGSKGGKRSTGGGGKSGKSSGQRGATGSGQ